MDIATLKQQFDSELATAASEADLRGIRDRYLARKGGVISNLLKDLASAPVEERRTRGAALNEIKTYAETRIDSAQTTLVAKPRVEAVDVTLPGRPALVGHRHPLTLMRERVEQIFQRFGFLVVEGPELEDDYHNFEALNMPAAVSYTHLTLPTILRV